MSAFSKFSSSKFADDDARWTAVARRDREADGVFFSCVRTTGVYCRPSCPGRPKRENVEFHATAAEARAAGFRACKRCRPDELADPRLSAASDADIRFTVSPCSLGFVLVAASGTGVCAVSFGDDQTKLVAELRGRWPSASERRDDRRLKTWADRVAAFVEAPRRTLDLPLDVQGTAFQRRVWDALRDIPAGSTASYGEIAERIGAPESARAVARACADNRIAALIPCHRVVRSSGALSGYRWGAARKQALLEREAR